MDKIKKWWRKYGLVAILVVVATIMLLIKIGQLIFGF